MDWVRVRVVMAGAVRRAGGYAVFGDGGSGAIDWAHPISVRRRRRWSGDAATAGYLGGDHLVDGPGCGEASEGHLEGTHALDEALRPAGSVEHACGPYVFGRFQHAVAPQDACGNVDVSGAAVTACVVNAAPPGVRELRGVSVEGGRVRIAFRGSERLVG